MFRCVDTFSLIMPNQARVEVASDTGVMNVFVAFANENIDIEEAVHLLACQAVVFEADRNAAVKCPPSQGYGVTAGVASYALRGAASVLWDWHAESKLAALMWQGETGSAFTKVTARQFTLSAAAASVDWRRGELNPCPRRFRRKHLHVYPVMDFKEPNVAPAHCRLPSVREIPSPSGAVAPPKD